MQREWVAVPNFEGFYEANENGEVRSLDRYVNHWQGGKCLKKGVILNPSLTKKGYKTVRLSINGIGGFKPIHRIIAFTFIPNPKNLPQVNHIDGNKLNNHVSNLEWISNLDNMRHSFRIGTHKSPLLGRKGELHPINLLSNSDILNINKKRENGISVKQISIEYKVSWRTIYRAIEKYKLEIINNIHD